MSLALDPKYSMRYTVLSSQASKTSSYFSLYTKHIRNLPSVTLQILVQLSSLLNEFTKKINYT